VGIAIFAVLALVLLFCLIPKKTVPSNSVPSYPLHGVTAAFSGGHAVLLWILFLVGAPILLWIFGLFDR
jgi:hypothetical protein